MDIGEKKIAHASGTMEGKSFNLEPLEDLENGLKLIRMSSIDLYHGELEGSVKGEFIAMLHKDNSSDYVGMYHFKGTLGEIEGSFLLEVKGSSNGFGLSQGILRIVNGSGSMGFQGINGIGGFSYETNGASSFWLDYSFERRAPAYYDIRVM